jgi:uncharacterized protein
LSLYLDTSVLVPIHVKEPTSDMVDRWLDRSGDTIVVSDLAAGEFASALSRSVRMNKATRQLATEILRDFDRWKGALTDRVQNTPEDICAAVILVRVPSPKLLMPDAIHLATCRRTGHLLVTFDAGLAESANQLGIGCISPT